MEQSALTLVMKEGERLTGDEVTYDVVRDWLTGRFGPRFPLQYYHEALAKLKGRDLPAAEADNAIGKKYSRAATRMGKDGEFTDETLITAFQEAVDSRLREKILDATLAGDALATHTWLCWPRDRSGASRISNHL
eukprot:GHVN01098098.1.p1 GENE.GHVN01098098.1~~GHVN01098098.1.p1  ORF type:complete len:135 (-),score=9.76 GHVN01098098.1:51-455(-)